MDIVVMLVCGNQSNALWKFDKADLPRSDELY